MGKKSRVTPIKAITIFLLRQSRPRTLSLTRSMASSSTPKTAPLPGAGKLFKADPIADTFRSDIQRSLSALSKPPKLVGILASDSKPSETYAEFTRKTCQALGVEFVLKRVGAAKRAIAQPGDDVEEEGEGAVEEAIVEANSDESIGGIMVRSVRLTVRSDLSSDHRCTIPSLAGYKTITFNRLLIATLTLSPLVNEMFNFPGRLASQRRRRAQRKVSL